MTTYGREVAVAVGAENAGSGRLAELLSGGPGARSAVGEALARHDPVSVAATGRRRSAVTVTLVESDDELAFWLTRRAPKMRAHAGQFALPGGRMDPGEDAVDTALRELEEELGIKATRSQCLGTLDDYATRSGYVITPVVTWLGARLQPVPNPTEVSEVHPVPLRELDVPPRFLTIPESDRPVIQLPLIGHLVHAPTAAVLYQFREVVLHRRATRVADLEQPVFAWR